MIRKLREFQIGQVIRQEGPATHRTKAGTPTMGGLLILTSALVPTLLWANLQNAFIWVAVLATVAFGAVGFCGRLPEDRPAHPSRAPAAVQARTAARHRALRRARVAGARQYGAAAVQHATRFPVLQARSIPDLGWLYAAFRDSRARRRHQRRESHRRARRPRDQRFRRCRGCVHRTRATSAATASSPTTFRSPASRL